MSLFRIVIKDQVFESLSRCFLCAGKPQKMQRGSGFEPATVKTNVSASSGWTHCGKLCQYEGSRARRLVEGNCLRSSSIGRHSITGLCYCP